MVRVGELAEDAPEAEVEQYLRQRCSDETVCSSTEGFFSHYLAQIRENVSDHFLAKFGRLASDEERILCIWGVKPIHTLKVQSFYRRKSREVSEGRRAEGNTALQEKRHEAALLLYSQAVMRAPHDDGHSLALAYANRSVALSRMGQHRLALHDIQLALDAGYPAALTYKVLERRGHCHQQLGHFAQARAALAAAAEALKQSGLEAGKRQAWAAELARKMQACEGKDDACQVVSTPEKARLFDGASPALPHASAAVVIQQTQDQGRFAVVDRHVPAGEVLVAEKPFAAILVEEKKSTHCTHCYHRLVAPVPCPRCSGVAFCSPVCRDAALASYHGWECTFLDLLKGSGVSLNAYLALRVITKHSLEFFKKARPHLHEPATLPSADSPHQPDSYRSFYQLEGLESMRTPWEFFQRALLACFLLKVLQRVGYFGAWDDEGPPDKGLSEDEAMVGGLLLRHLQVIQLNAHELSGMAFAEGNNNFKKVRSVFIGLAVYPTVAFCNHSCYPAVTRYFEGERMVLVSLRPLGPGDVVAENYGPIFTNHPRQLRQRKLLSRYWFRCGCEACRGDWPDYDHMTGEVRLSCPSCRAPLPAPPPGHSHVPCRECGAKTNAVAAMKIVTQAQKLYACGRRLMDEAGEREEAITAFTRYVAAVAGVVAPPLRDLHLAMQSLRLLVAARGTIHTAYLK